MLYSFKRYSPIFIALLLFSSSSQSVFDGVANPRVSIITSVYKGDTFIRGFLEDIVKQTIFSECELILINADSPENEEPIIYEYLTKYPNMRYIRLDKDPGIYGVWNLGIKMAHSEYITNANLDDRLHPQCYEIHAHQLDENPVVGVVYSGSYCTLKPHESFDAPQPHWKIMDHTQRSYTKEEMLYGFNRKKPRSIPFPHSHPMWRRDLHKKYGLFDSRLKAAGDLEMWLRLRLIGNVSFKMVKGIYGLYYWNPKGLSTANFPNLNEHDLDEHHAIDVLYRRLYEELFSAIDWLS